MKNSTYVFEENSKILSEIVKTYCKQEFYVTKDYEDIENFEEYFFETYFLRNELDNIFKDNPGLDVAYKTADGKYFYTENGAQNHALTLKNQEVKKVVASDERQVTSDESDESDKVDTLDESDKTGKRVDPNKR